MVLLGGLVVLALWFGRRREAPPVEVTVVAVQRGRVRDFVTSAAAGRVAPKQEATLRAEIAGKVVKLHKKRGDKVAAGEALLEYDPVELDERVKVAAAAVELARAQSAQADQSHATAASNAARSKTLFGSGSIPQAELDASESQAKVLAKAADAARAGTTQAAANLSLAKLALVKTVVRAPFGGTVLSTSIEVGEISTPGAPLLVLADLSVLHVDADVDEADLGRLRVGLPADVTFDAFRGERMRGKLTEIAPSVVRDPRGGGRSVPIDVELPADARLLVGMSAEVDVIVDVRESALFVPPNAVLGRGAERAVFVVEGGVAKRRKVEVGISTWEAVEIKSGVAEGERVVTSLGAEKLSDGARVALKEPAP